jgi:hypothetical protein
MSAQIKRFDVLCVQDADSGDWETYKDYDDSGDFIDYTDHLAAMAAASAYDEEKERALFEGRFGKLYDLVFCDETGEYESDGDQALWYGWKSCAKARAKAGGE